jgi:hypothetical protein
MNVNRLIVHLATGLVAGACSLSGATLGLEDGSRIEGDLIKIHDGTVYFETAFAGVLEIPQEQVISLTSEEVLNLRTAGGEVFRGPVSGEADGQVAIDSQAGPVEAGLRELTSAWRPGTEDPVVVAREAELESQLRKWSYTASVDISGDDGNTDEFSSELALQAKLEGPGDTFVAYGSYKYEETDGTRTKDEQIGGIGYTNYFTEKLGWYLRQELERDTFEGIDFRSTSGGGLSYRFIKQEQLELIGHSGLSYRYESYTDEGLDSEGFPGLDFALQLDWQFAEWGKLVSTLAYLPSFDDFGDYLIEHDSGVNIPLGTSDFWVMRFGLSHDYNSQVSSGREKLDTEYYIRLILNWD